MNNHLIKKRCPQTSDPPALRKTTELTAQIRRFLNSKFFLADDVLFLMLNGMNDEDKAIFLDGLIICGKQFDTSNPSLEVPLSLCRLYSDEPPILRNQNESVDSPPDDYIYFKYGFIAREQKILNKIANFTDQEIRNLGNSVQCPYCHQLYNGPYANYYRHLIKNKCAKTDDDRPKRLLQQLTSYAWKHIYSNCYIHDDELNLMINGLSERSISIFLDALIVGGKVFNISNEQIQSSLPLCRYIL
uniref:Uncharacterized protein n=1 Tax=Panagrolaimus davidi TaxID=227884 RepID=A0A914PZ66_9BILA